MGEAVAGGQSHQGSTVEQVTLPQIQIAMARKN